MSELKDRDFIVQGTHVDRLKKDADDFEKRLRDLEKFKEQQVGFARANYHWIVVGIVIITQVIVVLVELQY